LQKSADVYERLIREHPSQVRIVLRFGESCNQTSMVMRETGDLKGSLPWAARSILLLEGVLKKEPAHAEARVRLVGAYMDRAEVFVRLGRKEDAFRDWDRMIELGERNTLPNVRMYRAMALAHRGKHALATAEVEAMLANAVEPENAQYNFPCIYSLSSAAVLDDAKLPLSERKRLAEQYVNRAVELLAKARGAGFFKDLGIIEYAKKDTDLDPLRAHDEFKKLIRQLEEDAKAAPVGERK
jgi:tetratricopeptide (TPR) repeat protein